MLVRFFISNFNRIGESWSRKTCAPRQREWLRHAVCYFRRAVNMKITKENKEKTTLLNTLTLVPSLLHSFNFLSPAALLALCSTRSCLFCCHDKGEKGKHHCLIHFHLFLIFCFLSFPLQPFTPSRCSSSSSASPFAL